MGFEWTVRFGDLLTMGGAIFVAFGILYRRGQEDVRIDDSIKKALEELKGMKEQLERFSDAIGKIAVQEMQIGLLMKWYDELRRGQGWIQGSGGVDREYK